MLQGARKLSRRSPGGRCLLALLGVAQYSLVHNLREFNKGGVECQEDGAFLEQDYLVVRREEVGFKPL